MDPEHLRWTAGAVAHGRFLECPNGSHLALDDDQEICMNGSDRLPSRRRLGAVLMRTAAAG